MWLMGRPFVMVSDRPRRAAEQRSAQRPLSVREVAELCGVKPHKVLIWILYERLIAHDVSSSISQKPRWKIDPKDLEAFFQRRLDLRRAAAAEKNGAARTRTAQKRKGRPGVTEYF